MLRLTFLLAIMTQLHDSEDLNTTHLISGIEGEERE